MEIETAMSEIDPILDHSVTVTMIMKSMKMIAEYARPGQAALSSNCWILI